MKNRNHKNSAEVFKAATAAVLALGCATSIDAATISLDDPSVGATPDVTVSDQGLQDSNPMVGAVTYVGAIPNSGWILNVTTGVSKPILPAGGAGGEELDLNSVNVQAQSAGTLVLKFSDFNFAETVSGYSFFAGGTLNAPAGSTISFDAYGDAGNGLFGEATPLGSLGQFSPGAFSGTDGISGSLPPNHSLTIVATINLAGAGTVSFDADLASTPSVPDGGLSLAMLGFAVAGVEGLRRKIGSKK